jgi:AcrR family transcriptional regulator
MPHRADAGLIAVPVSPSRTSDSEAAPTLNRRDRRKLELSQRILEAGEALFQDQGYDDTKVAEICERADVAYGTFFNHFPNKADILSAMADRSVREIAEHLQTLAEQPGSLEEQLIQLFEGEAQQIQGLTPLSRDLLGRVQALAFTDSPEDRDRRFHAAFESFLRRGVEAGRVRSDVPVGTLADVVSSTFASMSLSWVHFDDSPVGERAANAARFLANALAPQKM